MVCVTLKTVIVQFRTVTPVPVTTIWFVKTVILVLRSAMELAKKSAVPTTKYWMKKLILAYVQKVLMNRVESVSPAMIRTVKNAPSVPAPVVLNSSTLTRKGVFLA